MLLLSISKNFLQSPSSDDTLSGNSTWSDSFVLVEGLIRLKRGFNILIRLKRGFNIFLIDHYVGDIWNKNIAGTY